MGKGYYIKKDKKDGLTLNIKKDQFIQYLQALQGDWMRFKIYERDTIASNGLTWNMELIERKSEEMGKPGRPGRNKGNSQDPTNQIDV